MLRSRSFHGLAGARRLAEQTELLQQPKSIDDAPLLRHLAACESHDVDLSPRRAFSSGVEPCDRSAMRPSRDQVMNHQVAFDDFVCERVPRDLEMRTGRAQSHSPGWRGRPQVHQFDLHSGNPPRSGRRSARYVHSGTPRRSRGGLRLDSVLRPYTDYGTASRREGFGGRVVRVNLYCPRPGLESWSVMLSPSGEDVPCGVRNLDCVE